MKRYAIADYLSDEEKQRILSHRFVVKGEETGERDADGLPIVHRFEYPVSIDDQACPLAYVPGVESTFPGSVAVALAIRGNGFVEYFEDNFDVIQDAAAEFIEAWDRGDIPPNELAIALGVEDA